MFQPPIHSLYSGSPHIGFFTITDQPCLSTLNYDGNDGSTHHPGCVFLIVMPPCEWLNTLGWCLPGGFVRGFLDCGRYLSPGTELSAFVLMYTHFRSFRSISRVLACRCHLVEPCPTVPLPDPVLEVYISRHMQGMHGKLKFVTDSSYRCLSLNNSRSPFFSLS